MKSLTKLAFFFMLMMFFGSLKAQQNPLIAMTGALKDANGAAVPDGAYQVVFNLYNEPMGGISKWTETAMMEVKGGLYNHLLGSVNPLVPSIFDQTQFLGVSIGVFEFTPRSELTYAPYTYRSFTAIFAEKVVCSGAVGDVKYSSLPPAQFAQVNGACWVPMDGRSIAGSLLAEGLNENNIPDASGIFFRAHEYIDSHDPDRTPASPIATIQLDAMKGHGHTGEANEAGEHSHSVSPTNGNNSGSIGWPLNTADGANGSNTGTSQDGSLSVNALIDDNISGPGHNDHTLSINTAGGVETRPVNVNFYAYIRIN